MNVLYTCDDNYIWLMGISLISLLENNKNVEEINIFLLGENISVENRDKLNQISEKYGRTITIIEPKISSIPKELVSTRWPLSAFSRLYSAELLPEYLDKILYLDCDTIITTNIEELYNQDVDNCVLKGVKDCIGKQYKVNIGLNEDDIYINAGVLLLNLNKLRNIDVNLEISNFIKKYTNLISYADQDILNGIFKDKMMPIKPNYNVMTIDCVYKYKDIICLRRPTFFYTQDEMKDAVQNPYIIHYTTNMRIIRPWYLNSNHPYKDEFLKYYEISLWNEKELVEYHFKSNESKIIKLLQILPHGIAIRILGFLHAILKPKIKYLKYK